MQKYTSVSSNIVVILVGSVVPLPSTTLDGGVLVAYKEGVKQIVAIKLKAR